MRGEPGGVLRPAGVDPRVLVVNTSYAQQGRPLPQHGGREDGVGGHDLSLETPGDGEGLVAPGDDTDELGELSLVDHLPPEGEGDNVGLLCNKNISTASPD